MSTLYKYECTLQVWVYSILVAIQNTWMHMCGIEYILQASLPPRFPGISGVCDAENTKEPC